MGVREGLLALLARGPRHGYQLKLEFEAATGEVWPINIGQVYTTLQRLERDGLVAGGEADEEGRIVYELTGDGLAEATTWFTTAVDRTVPGRDEVTIKLLLAMVAGVVDPHAVVDAQRVATLTALQDYTRLKSEADPDADVAWLLQLERLVMQADAELRWLDRVEDRLGLVPERPLGPGAIHGGGSQGLASTTQRGATPTPTTHEENP
ncbi:MAG: PadR family transcriptional regulator [Nitriliruptoraceae bacterium]